MAASLEELAKHLKDDPEAMFEPHPSEEELREFWIGNASPSRDRIARHLGICASCALEVDVWRKMGDKPIPAVPVQGGVTTQRPRRRAIAGMPMGLATAAGLLIGIALGYVARDRAVSPSRIPALAERPQPSVSERPLEVLPRIGPQLLLPRPLRGEEAPAAYRIGPRQQAVIVACPASVPKAAAPTARFRYELTREGETLAWSQEMTAAAIRAHKERTGVVTLLIPTGVLETGRTTFRLIAVDAPGGSLYRVPIEWTKSLADP
jgi:hypothetical protein